MLVKILGAFDFVSGLILIFSSGFILPSSVSVFFGIILLTKSLIGFLKDFASWIDLISGAVFFLLVLFNVPGVICLILGILLIQKGIFSFL